MNSEDDNSGEGRSKELKSSLALPSSSSPPKSAVSGVVPSVHGHGGQEALEIEWIHCNICFIELCLNFSPNVAVCESSGSLVVEFCPKSKDSINFHLLSCGHILCFSCFSSGSGAIFVYTHCVQSQGLF